MIVFDDHVLLSILAEPEKASTFDPLSTGLATTASWHFRALRAVRLGSGRGSLSGMVSALKPEEAVEVVERLEMLPLWIETGDLRTLVPAMVACASVGRSNFLSLEAVALAVVTEAELVVTTSSPTLTELCRAMDVPLRVVSVS